MESILTKNQKKQFEKIYTEDGQKYKHVVTVRYDDKCGNGHNTFAITSDIRIAQGGYWQEHSCGCCHDEVAKHFPELAHFIKWHLTNSDGPMYYVENTTYHAREHEALSGWLYFTEPLTAKEINLKYGKLAELRAMIDGKGNAYRIEPDEKSAKVANLDAARKCAVWPDATPEQLRSEIALKTRLPALMLEFKADIERLGFTY